MLEDLLIQLRQKDIEINNADQSGLAAIFELSWQSLSLEAQTLGCFLSLFGLAPISRKLLEQILDGIKLDHLPVDDLSEPLAELVKKFLVQVTRPDTYALHELMRERFEQALSELSNADALKHIYCKGIATLARQMPGRPTLADIEAFSPRVPHIIEAATTLQSWLTDKDLTWPYVCLGRFYEVQSAFDQAELWYARCLDISYQRLDNEHLDVAVSLNNLAVLYDNQGYYSEAERFYQEALVMYKRLLSNKHPDVALSLSSLAVLYDNQGHHSEAEPLLQEALTIWRELAQKSPRTYLPYVARTLNDLALLQKAQNELIQAQTNYQEALAIRRQLAKENPRAYLPYVAGTLNDLALLQANQKELEAAQTNYQEALAIRRQLAQENPLICLPHVAATLINLSIFYLQTKPDKDRSVATATEALEILQGFQNNPSLQRYTNVAIQILKANVAKLD
ncbi:MAG: tetratricopeptide repeat protein [Cyanobacteria bacterium P01_G01_bin.38]